MTRTTNDRDRRATHAPTPVANTATRARITPARRLIRFLHRPCRHCRPEEAPAGSEPNTRSSARECTSSRHERTQDGLAWDAAWHEPYLDADPGMGPRVGRHIADRYPRGPGLGLGAGCEPGGRAGPGLLAAWCLSLHRTFLAACPAPGWRSRPCGVCAPRDSLHLECASGERLLTLREG
jgi:hypothetical protein